MSFVLESKKNKQVKSTTFPIDCTSLAISYSAIIPAVHIIFERFLFNEIEKKNPENSRHEGETTPW